MVLQPKLQPLILQSEKETFAQATSIVARPVDHVDTRKYLRHLWLPFAGKLPQATTIVSASPARHDDLQPVDSATVPKTDLNASEAIRQKDKPAFLKPLPQLLPLVRSQFQFLLMLQQKQQVLSRLKLLIGASRAVSKKSEGLVQLDEPRHSRALLLPFLAAVGPFDRGDQREAIPKTNHLSSAEAQVQRATDLVPPVAFPYYRWIEGSAAQHSIDRTSSSSLHRALTCLQRSR